MVYSEPFKSLLVEMRLQAIENIEMRLNSLGARALEKLSYLLDNAENETTQLRALTFI